MSEQGQPSPLPSDAVLAAIVIDLAALQLEQTEILEEVVEIERHFHTQERWWGAVAVPDETNAIEANVNRPFAATSGANTWGAAIPICGTDDNPVQAGDTLFDPHRILVVDLDDDTTPWRFRIIFGTGTSAQAIIDDQWSEIMVTSNVVPGNKAGGTPANILMCRHAVGVKMWAQAWNDTNGEVLDFFYGCHGYVD